jgi:hypothetical protein
MDKTTRGVGGDCFLWFSPQVYSVVWYYCGPWATGEQSKPFFLFRIIPRRPVTGEENEKQLFIQQLKN